MYAWAHEVDDSIKKPFLGNKLIRIWGIYGFVNDSLEFRMTDEWFAYDLLFAYKLNSTHQLNGFHGYGKRFRQYLPSVKELCSAELLNGKYLVPCNIIEYLNAQFGEMESYMRPILRSHKEPSINYKIGYEWDISQLPYVFRSYGEDGNVSEERSLRMLNNDYFKKYNLTLTKLPT